MLREPRKHNLGGICMKKLLAILLSLFLFTSVASAEGWGGLLGGLSSLFSASDEVTYGVGEKAEVDDLVITLTDVMTSKGNSYYKPISGNEYVILQFEIENKSEEDVVISTMMNFTFWCDDTNYVIDVNALATAMLSGKYQLDCAVEAGKKVSGVIGYEVPQNWEQLKIEFRKEIIFGDAVTFLVDKNAK